MVDLSFGTAPEGGAQRVGVFGEGGIGKTTLCAFLPNVAFLDLDRGVREIQVLQDSDIPNWLTLRGKLARIAESPPPGIEWIVIDSASKAEELAKEHVVQTRRSDGGKTVDSIEGFGWDKGWQYVAEEFNALLADLDRIVERGVNVCLVMHAVATVVPYPSGDDYLRWEPLLYGGNRKGKGSIRDRVFTWADHFLFIGYDLYTRDGKVQSGGTRTIYSGEGQTHIAKSRRVQTSIAYDPQDPGAIWRLLRFTS